MHLLTLLRFLIHLHFQIDINEIIKLQQEIPEKKSPKQLFNDTIPQQQVSQLDVEKQ
jgi:hypothetical protein